MVGGIVTETVWLADRIWVNCVAKEENSNDHCAIYVERNAQSELIKPSTPFGGKVVTRFGRRMKIRESRGTSPAPTTTFGFQGSEALVSASRQSITGVRCGMDNFSAGEKREHSGLIMDERWSV